MMVVLVGDRIVYEGRDMQEALRLFDLHKQDKKPTRLLRVIDEENV